jgi:aspartyl-tRNA(Asn)/glutamyl-tRNA(Gln) amidotransferase subunit C
MKVSEQDVAYVAELAQLELTSDERTRLQRDLNNILEYIAVLNELNTSNVPPMQHAVTAAETSDANTMRADIATPVDRTPADADAYASIKHSLDHEDAMRNAPDSNGVYFKVPKVIER